MRYIVYIFVVGVIALPAQALTFDLWNSLEQAAFNLLNADRTGQGIGVVTADARLHNAARSHSRDMASNNFFSHTGSDGSRAGNRITAQGYNFLSWGENIAAGQQTAVDVIAAWLNSPGHRDNMRGRSFTDAAIGQVKGGTGADFSSYWTMVLASGDSTADGSPVASNPTAGSPSTGTPSTGNPSAGNPTPGNPSTGNPATGNPTNGSPFAGNQLAQMQLPSIGQPTADVEAPSEVPLPPAIWLFAVALTCGLLFARRHTTTIVRES